MRTKQSERKEISDEHDSELLLMIAAGDGMEREMAASEFYRRYNKLLYSHCSKYLNSLGESGVSDLVILTLQKAFAKAYTYDEGGGESIETVKARTTKWLFRIADNLFIDSGRSARISDLHLLTTGASDTGPIQYERLSDEEEFAYDYGTSLEAFEESEGNADNDSEMTSECVQCLADAERELSQQQREILHMSLQYATNDKQLRIPSDILNSYCENTNTTKENVRAIRKRTLARLREYARKHCPSCFK